MLATALDRIGRPLNPAQLPSFRLGQAPANKGKEYPKVALTRDEVEALLSACGRGPVGVRNRALVRLCVDTGLRDKEVRGLDLRSIDLDAGELRVLGHTAKFGKSRVLGVPSSAVALVREWIAVREQIPGAAPRSGPLFCTVTRGSAGLQLSDSSMRNSLPKIARRAGIEKRVHMHALRHTFAYQWIRDGKPIDVLSKALGHKDLKTTFIYIDHLMPAEVVDMMRGGQVLVDQRAQRVEVDPEQLAAVLARPDVAAVLAAALQPIAA